MEQCEKDGLTTKQFYGLMQEWMGDKILVDKTPSYPLDIEVLRRAEQDFEDVMYIHLTRHPYATIYSFLEAKLDMNFFRWDHPFTRRELAEMIWMICHRNVMDFLKEIPQKRQHRIKFEDLLSDPGFQCPFICF